MYSYEQKRYYLSQPNTYPIDGVVATHAYAKPIYVEGAGLNKVCGYADYKRDLTPDEIRDYGLVPELTGEEKIISIVMHDNEYDRAKAVELVTHAKTAILAAMAKDDTEAAEEILASELYLPADYLDDIL